MGKGKYGLNDPRSRKILFEKENRFQLSGAKVEI